MKRAVNKKWLHKKLSKSLAYSSSIPFTESNVASFSSEILEYSYTTCKLY